MGIFPRFRCSRGNVLFLVSSQITNPTNHHNQVKPWEHFRDFIVAVGIFLCDSHHVPSVATNQSKGVNSGHAMASEHVQVRHKK